MREIDLEARCCGESEFNYYGTYDEVQAKEIFFNHPKGKVVEFRISHYSPYKPNWCLPLTDRKENHLEYKSGKHGTNDSEQNP